MKFKSLIVATFLLAFTTQAMSDDSLAECKETLKKFKELGNVMELANEAYGLAVLPTIGKGGVGIGGAAGSAAVLSGSAAAGTWNAPGALVLALILFLWSPFHFWSLALLYRNDYARADFPMLPANTSPRGAATWIMVHTVPAGIAGLALAALPFLGWSYLIPVLLVTIDLLWRAIRLLIDPSARNARKLFISSNIYLLVLLIAICVGSVLPF